MGSTQQRLVCRPAACFGWIAVSAVLLIPAQASAHVKWFSTIADVTQPPIALGRVVTPLFALVCAAFVALVFAGFLIDGAVARRWPRLASSGRLHAATEEKLVRLAVGAYFLLLWNKGAVVSWEHGDSLLTPELMASAGWIGVVQFAVALATGWRRTCIVAAVGIGVLYGYGITQFGVFHMTDYVFFPGLAAYLALTTIGTQLARRLRVPLLAGSLAFSLMWTAVEKFVYPEWTLFVIAGHPDLTFGFPPGFVIVVAGFVEFTLAFYLLTGRGLVRFGAAAYAAIFLAAIPEFGHLDTTGHMPIVGILAVVCLRGASPWPRLLGIADTGGLRRAASVTALYAVSLTGLFAMYYGLQWAEYG